MNRKTLLLSIAAGATLLAGSVLASDIYRYTDAEGNVHYVDRPTGEPTEERVAILSRRTDTTQVQARAESQTGRPATAEGEPPAAGAEAPKKQTRAERRAAAAEKAEKCQTYRDQMETLVTSRRLYREDENGERVYLDESQTQEARDKVQQRIEETCD